MAVVLMEKTKDKAVTALLYQSFGTANRLAEFGSSFGAVFSRGTDVMVLEGQDSPENLPWNF